MCCCCCCLWLGFGLTCLALGGGLVSMVRSDKVRSQYFMRARIAAQGATILALLWAVNKQNKQSNKTATIQPTTTTTTTTTSFSRTTPIASSTSTRAFSDSRDADFQS